MTAARDALAEALSGLTATAVNLPGTGYTVVAEDMADQILAGLAAAGWSLVNAHRKVSLGADRAVCAADGLPWPCKNSPEGDTP